MQNNQVDPQIKDIFKKVLEIEEIDINTAVGDIDKWDSLGHINLVMLIEEQFGIRLEFSEIVELTSVKKIQLFLEEKGLLL